ncbi:MAG: phosphatidate cytidylyltransferase [Pseudomonadota bacterium]
MMLLYRIMLLGKGAMVRLVEKLKTSNIALRSVSSLFLLVGGALVIFGAPIFSFIVICVCVPLAVKEWHGMVQKIAGHILAKYAYLCLIILAAFGFLFFSSIHPDRELWLGGVILITAMSDMSAYISGKIIGGVKPFPNISSGKTLSGYIGGAVITTCFAGLYFHKFAGIFLSETFIMTFILTICGQAGDLYESYLKRLADIKDSGSIIPGHGGVLDRLDAFFVILTLMFLYNISFTDQGYAAFISLF